jgi:hypothetical protein
MARSTLKKGASAKEVDAETARQRQDTAYQQALNAADRKDWGVAGAPARTALLNRGKRRGAEPNRHVL